MAVGLAFSRADPDAEIAALLDHRLGLKDRLGSALHAAQHTDHPFAAGVVAEAEQAAARARVGEALPWRGSGSTAWRWTAVAVALLAVVVVFLPPTFDPLGLRAQRADEQRQREAQAAAEAELREAVALIDPEEEERELGAADGEPEDLMDRLEAVLSKRDLRTPDARREAEAELSAIRDELAEQAEAERAQDQAMRAALSGLETSQAGPADRFVEAMRRGDYDAARQEMQRLAERVDNEQLSDTQREKLQEQLEEIAEQLQEQAEQQQDAAEQAQQNLQEQLQDAGMSEEQAQQAAQQNTEPGTSSQQAQQQLQDAGASQQQAQQLSQQTQQSRQQAQQNQSNGQASQNLADAVQQMADCVEQGGSCSSPSQQAQQQLGQMSQQQQQAARTQQAQQQVSNAQQALSQGQQPGASQGQSPGQGQQPGAGQQPGQSGSSGSQQPGPGQPGRGGPGGFAGQGEGGNPLGRERGDPNLGSVEVFDIQEGEGRVISSWQQGGASSAGKAQVEFRSAVTAAQADAERAVNDDRAPRRYHRAISRYFRGLPETPLDQDAGDGSQ